MQFSYLSCPSSAVLGRIRGGYACNDPIANGGADGGTIGLEDDFVTIVGDDVFGDVGETEGSVLSGDFLDGTGTSDAVVGAADYEDGEGTAFDCQSAEMGVVVAKRDVEEVTIHDAIATSGEAKTTHGVVLKTANIFRITAEPCAFAFFAESTSVGRGEVLKESAATVPASAPADEVGGGEGAAGEEGVVPAGAADDGACNGVGMEGEVATDEEGAHGVAHDEVGNVGPALLGFAAEEVDIGDDNVGAVVAIGEVAALVEGVEAAGAFGDLASGEAVAEVVVADDGDAALGEFAGEGVVAVDVFFHTVDELENSAGCFGGFPGDVVELLRGVGGREVVFGLFHDADGLFGKDDVGDDAAGVDGVDAGNAHGGEEVVDAAVGLGCDGEGEMVVAPEGGDGFGGFFAADAENVLVGIVALAVAGVEEGEFALAVAAGGGEEDDGGATAVAEAAVVGGAVGEGDDEVGHGVANVDDVVVVGVFVEAGDAECGAEEDEEGEYVGEFHASEGVNFMRWSIVYG